MYDSKYLAGHCVTVQYELKFNDISNYLNLR